MLEDPRVVLNLLESEALLGVQSEYVLDEMADLLGEVVGELEVDGPDALVGFVIVGRLKRREPAAEFVA